MTKHDWEEYRQQFLAIMKYIRILKAAHGLDGKNVVIEDLALRLARLRAGIPESTKYGE